MLSEIKRQMAQVPISEIQRRRNGISTSSLFFAFLVPSRLLLIAELGLCYYLIYLILLAFSSYLLRRVLGIARPCKPSLSCNDTAAVVIVLHNTFIAQELK